MDTHLDTAPARTLITPDDLLLAGLVDTAAMSALHMVADRYATAIPSALQGAIAETGVHGPIARQFVPTAAELVTHPTELSDPIGDAAHSPVKGLVHRYPDRALLMPTLACAVYCRFCFRREVVGQDGTLSSTEMDAAMDYIARAPGIWEVILTGGDPLTLSSRRLGDIVRRLSLIDHVKVLRLHTRVPIATPERIDAALIAALSATTKTVYMGIHCNHPAELAPDVVTACDRLTGAGISLLGQSVLLRGVNDCADTLEALLRAMVVARIKPYYLHQLDLAPGTSHFRVSIEEGQALMRLLKSRLSGIAMPAYMLDVPGGHGKVPIGPTYLSPGGQNVVDPAGVQHSYPPPAP